MTTSSLPPWPWWIGGALLTLSALILLYWALLHDRARGRRRCPSCWYDLSGTEALTCSECGHAARDERRLLKTRRRWRWGCLGLAMLLIGLGLPAYHVGRSFDWYTVMPVWWLKQEGTARAAGGWKARQELIRRLEVERLSDAQVEDLVEHVLAIQADPDATWSPPGTRFGTGWGTFFEEAWRDDRVSDEQLARYLRTAFGVSFTVTPRARIRAGRSLPVRFRTGAPRASELRAIFDPEGEVLVAEAEIVSLTVDGGEIPVPNRTYGIGQAGMGGWMTEPSFECDLAPGTYEVRFVLRCTARIQPRHGAWQVPERGPVDLTTWEQSFESTVEVVPVHEPSVEMVPDESMRELIREAINVELVERQLTVGGTQYGSQHGMILFDTVPVDLSFDVFCRAGGVEQQIGAIVVHADQPRLQNAQRITENAQALFPDAASVDVILRSSPMAAERTVDVDRVWEGEIVIEGVPLR